MHAQSDPPTAIVHMPALDGLRGIAILLVVTHHFGAAAGFGGAQPALIGNFIERLLYIGWAGVDLFFVLSGFLITSVLLASKGRDGYFVNFYGRRALRIFPLYFGTLIVGLVALPLISPLPASFVGQAGDHPAWLWTYTTNIALALGLVASFGVYDLYWTLAIEEQFYLVWPLLLRVTRPRTIVLICLSLVLGALIWRALWIGAGGHWAQPYRFTTTRMDSLAIGALAALAAQDRPGLSRVQGIGRVVCGSAAVMLVAMIVWINPFYPGVPSVVVVGHTLLALTFAGLVMSVTTTTSRMASALSRPWLRACGRISYGMYVWHWPLRVVFDGVRSGLDPPVSVSGQWLRATAFLALGLGGSVALGWLSYHLFEKHFLRLKRRFAYSPGVKNARSVAAASIQSRG